MEINNKVFCALPFTYVYVDSLNEYKLCSDARLSSKINTNDMSILTYFNSDYLKEIRDDMIAGNLSEKIKGTCIRCIEREELGLWSRRETSIKKYVLETYNKKFYNIPTSDTIKLKFGNLCNLKCFMYCNGARLKGQFMKDVIDAGIDFVRFSMIGYDKEQYKKWMNIDNFDLIIQNINEAKEYIKNTGSKCQLSTYHLITDNNQLAFEVEEYKKNVVKKTEVLSYIWKMHNWSGNYENKNERIGLKKTSCGRPFAPEITIRAGGKEGRTSAMVPCCQTLGPPNEEKRT